MPKPRGRAVSDGLKLHLDDLFADLRLAGGYEGRDWVGEGGELRITLPYGTWRWGERRGDELVSLVQLAGKHGHINAAVAWSERWLAERDPAWKTARLPKAKRHTQLNDVPSAEVEAKLRAAHPDWLSEELWRNFGVAAPWRVTRVNEYKDATGRLLFLAARLQHPDPAIPKEFAHVAHYGLDGWRKTAKARQLREPIPLYNLPGLVAQPAAPVLVVEGEKAADVAAKDFPDYVVTTWAGGANRVGYADWSVLRDRQVALWPDNDADGLNAMIKLRSLLRHKYTPHVQMVPVDTLRLPPTWDLADKYEESFTGALAKREIEKALGEPDWLRELNAKYAVVNLGTHAAIYTLAEEHSPRPFRRPFKRWRPVDEKTFHLWYENRPADGEDKRGNLVYMPASKAWLQRPQRSEFSRLVFDPSGDAPATALNLYQAPEPRPDPLGERRPWVFLRFVYDVICSKRHKEFKAVMQLLAEFVQHPEEPWGVALVLKGLKGVGKTKFIELTCDLLPAHSTIHTNYEHAMSKFNDWIEGCLLVGFDEALYAGDKRHESYLKNMITGHRMQVEGKNAKQYATENMMHVILAGNPERLVNASADERRYVVIEVSDRRRGDGKYFQAVTDAWIGGEREQALNLLAAIDAKRKERRRPPDNEELLEQKLHSTDPFIDWLLYESQRADWPTQAVSPVHYNRFRDFLSDTGRMNGHFMNNIAFGKRLGKVFGKKFQSLPNLPGARGQRTLIVPPAEDLAELALPGAVPLRLRVVTESNQVVTESNRGEGVSDLFSKKMPI